MTDFIFVFLDDSTLDVVDPASNLNGAYEGIDVENGEYAFFDSQLRRMIPKFETMNSEGGLFGLRWVSSGAYVLEASEDGYDELINRLGGVAAINDNPWFETVDQVVDYVHSLRRG